MADPFDYGDPYYTSYWEGRHPQLREAPSFLESLPMDYRKYLFDVYNQLNRMGVDVINIEWVDSQIKDLVDIWQDPFKNIPVTPAKEMAEKIMKKSAQYLGAPPKEITEPMPECRVMLHYKDERPPKLLFTSDFPYDCTLFLREHEHEYSSIGELRIEKTAPRPWEKVTPWEPVRKRPYIERVPGEERPKRFLRDPYEGEKPEKEKFRIPPYFLKPKEGIGKEVKTYERVRKISHFLKGQFSEKNRERWEKFWESLGGSFEKCVEKMGEPGFAMSSPEGYCASLEKFISDKWPAED